MTIIKQLPQSPNGGMELHDYGPGTEVELKRWERFDRKYEYVEWVAAIVVQKNWSWGHEVLIVLSEFGFSIIRQASHIRLTNAPAPAGERT